MTFGEHLSEFCGRANREAEVPMPQIIFCLDMLSLELKSKLLADAVQRQAQEQDVPPVPNGGPI